MCVCMCVCVGGGWSLNPTHSPVGLLMNTSSAGGDLGNACTPLNGNVLHVVYGTPDVFCAHEKHLTVSLISCHSTLPAVTGGGGWWRAVWSENSQGLNSS